MLQISVQVLSICLISGSRQSVANTRRCGHSLGTANTATHIPNKDSSTGRVACSWPLKASYFRLGSQNLWAGLGKRRGDKAKWYLQGMSYIIQFFFKQLFEISSLRIYFFLCFSSLCRSPSFFFLHCSFSCAFLHLVERYESRKFMNSQKVIALKKHSFAM